MNEEGALTQMVGWEPAKFKPPNKTFMTALSPLTVAAGLRVLFNLMYNSCHNTPDICHRVSTNVPPRSERATPLLDERIRR